jgi:hypothetical protein
MLGMTVFLICLAILFFSICLLILLKADDYFTGARQLICPETRQPAGVRLDLRHRLLSLLRGQEELRLTSCARWPGRQACGQECLLQVDCNPAVLDRVLCAWAHGKCCALCQRPLTERDWRGGHFSGLDQGGSWVSAAKILLQNLPMALDEYRPVCWPCNLAQGQNRVPILLKGDRRGPRELPADGT